MKQPDECIDMDDIRLEIDDIDHQIVTLIGKRSKYVHAAAKYKKDKAAVKAPDRVEKMLRKRRQWAKDNSIDPEFIENLFSSIVEHFISSEMKDWEKEKNK